jgi:hypothetical protein
MQRFSRSLKRVKKPNQLPLLLVGKIHLEAFIVEVNQLLQVLGRIVVEVWCSGMPECQVPGLQ